MAEIESGSVEEMTHSSSDELLSEIRATRQRFRYWPLALIGGGILWFLLVGVAPGWMSAAGLVALFFLCIWLARRDVVRKTVVLMYDLDESIAAAYQDFLNGFEWLTRSRRAWHLEAQGDTSDWKKNAGATHLVRRKAIQPARSEPPALRTNLPIPMLPVGRQHLYFFPDRILVFERAAVGAVGYEQLRLKTTDTRFIEEGSVPEDAKVVGSTWKYINKAGGPDRRFHNNRQLPILRYAEIHLTSPTGLHEVIQVSSTEAAEYFARGVRRLAAAVTALPVSPLPAATFRLPADRMLPDDELGAGRRAAEEGGGGVK